MEKRVSKHKQSLEPNARTEARAKILKQLLTEEISTGQALKTLRTEVLALKQAQYAKLVSVSRKTLSDVENDRGNYSLDVLNRIFRPLGLEFALMPIKRDLLRDTFAHF